ncbi:MAG: hypothetical protein KDI71_17435 [Xanthomonadales bacterium]|nr:hypothetical protein [Xanthomonadales bacterium]
MILPGENHPYPRLRWFALLWLLLYLPTYALSYGAWHFLALCNLGVIVSSLGLLLGRPLLIGAPALLALLLGVIWLADVLWRLLLGSFLHGGTAYMWDPSIHWLTRTLSLYHLLWPPLLLYALSRSGYDRRSLALQGGLTALVLGIGVWPAPAAQNLNFVHAGFDLALAGAAPSLRALVVALLLGSAYGLTHLALCYLFKPAIRTWPRTPPRSPTPPD